MYTVLEFLNNLWELGTELPYRPARLNRLAELIPLNQFLGSLKVKKFGLCRESVTGTGLGGHTNFELRKRKDRKLTNSNIAKKQDDKNENLVSDFSMFVKFSQKKKYCISLQ
jgi:hypothetical protein